MSLPNIDESKEMDTLKSVPARKRTHRRMPKNSAKPAAQPKAKPTVQPVAKLAAKPKEKPAAKPATKPAAKPKEKPAAKPTAQPAAKPKEKPASKPYGKSNSLKSEDAYKSESAPYIDHCDVLIHFATDEPPLVLECRPKSRSTDIAVERNRVRSCVNYYVKQDRDIPKGLMRRADLIGLKL